MFLPTARRSQSGLPSASHLGRGYPPPYTYCIYTVTQKGGKMRASSQHLRTHCASPSARALQSTACRKLPLLSRSVRERQLFILMQFMSFRQNIEMRPILPTDSTCFAAACILFSNFSCVFLLEERAESSVGRKKTVAPGADSLAEGSTING